MIPISLMGRLRLRDPLTFALYVFSGTKGDTDTSIISLGAAGPFLYPEGDRETGLGCHRGLKQNVSPEPQVLSE